MAPRKTAGHESKTFTYRHGGSTIELPRFKSLKSGVIRKIRHLDEADVMFTVFEEVATPDVLAIIDDMEIGDLSELQKAWLKDSGVSLGESESSSS